MKNAILFIVIILAKLSFLNAENTNECNAENTSNYSQKFETKNVQQVVNLGFLFHVASYADGTNVVTCLDGPNIGLQIIYFNGVYQTDSRCVEWYADHFIHYYQHGRVISYGHQQIGELY